MPRTITVCQYKTCSQQGAAAVLKAFRAQVPVDVEVQSIRCLGECGNGPMALVLPQRIWYCQIAPRDVPRIVTQHLKGGKPVRGKLCPKYHSTRQPVIFWVLASALAFGFLGLFVWIVASQTAAF